MQKAEKSITNPFPKTFVEDLIKELTLAELKKELDHMCEVCSVVQAKFQADTHICAALMKGIGDVVLSNDTDFSLLCGEK